MKELRIGAVLLVLAVVDLAIVWPRLCLCDIIGWLLAAVASVPILLLGAAGGMMLGFGWDRWQRERRRSER